MFAKLFNWIGQLRVYSLVDLYLLLAAVGNPKAEDLLGGMLLHIAFLLWLESLHKDRGRLSFPKWAFPVVLLASLWLYPSLWYAGLYSGFSFLYTLKKRPAFGWASPLSRGAQTWALVSGLTGPLSTVALVGAILMIIRNAIGDWRDVTKDRSEGVQTIPVVLGIKKDWKRGHLYCMYLTTLSWGLLGGIHSGWIILTWVIQRLSYDWTPR